MLNTLRGVKHGTKRRWIDAMRFIAERLVMTATGNTVASGVFAGTRLASKDVFGSRIPKLIGSYEQELDAVIQASLQRRPNTVLNIGAAEGYYALGFARSGANQVIAFESLPEGRTIISENATLNQVDDKMIIKETCTEKVLSETLASLKVDLIVMDIEGGELDLLSDKIVDQLGQTELLIESHDFRRPGCLQILKDRLRSTHDLTVINSTSRQVSDFNLSLMLPDSMKLKLMDEQRPGTMSWLACVPKRGADVTSEDELQH